MTNNRATSSMGRLLLILGLVSILAACDSGSDNEDAPAIVVINASATEGFAPLDVTFDVIAPDMIISEIIWTFGDAEPVRTTGPTSISRVFLNPGTTVVTADVQVISPSVGIQNITIPVTVHADVNLVVSSFAIDTVVTPGAPNWETVSAIIQNVGINPLAGSGHINVGYFLSTDDVITVDDIYIGDTSIVIGDSFLQEDVEFGFESLSPGENYQYDHQLAIKSNLPAGTYFAGAIVDYIDDYEWYTFPRATDSNEFVFPQHVVVSESNENDNARVLPAHQVTVAGTACADDAFEPDNSSSAATPISPGQSQSHNFCHDNSDWLSFDAVQGSVYKISTTTIGAEVDTQLILYDRDGSSIILFHDNIGNDDDDQPGVPNACPPNQTNDTVDLECGWPEFPRSEIVWEAEASGTFFIKVRTTSCDEDKDQWCETLDPSPFSPEGIGSPDGVGLDTQYSILLE